MSELARQGQEGAKIKLGARWPDYEVPIERGVVKAFVEAVEELGYDHITAFDHLAGMTPKTRRGWRSSYTTDLQWAEPLTLFAHMSGLSESLGFLTAILGLPIRPTLLVAKQAATLDRMTEGRLRLGVGIGWNDIEFGVMGATFEDRPQRMEEQIAVLRALWTKESVRFRGEFHHLPSIGLSLAPIQQPIPIWLAAGVPVDSNQTPLKVLRRIGRLADGVIPQWAPHETARQQMEFIFDEAREAGRDPATIEFEPTVGLRVGHAGSGGIGHGEIRDDDTLTAQVQAWKEIGVSHLEFKSRSCGLTSIDEHVRELARFKAIADEVLG